MFRGTIGTEAMIEEVYKGIRPPRLSSCPDHLNLHLEITKCRKEIGVTLTESMAMWPASSVSGYYWKSRKLSILDWENKKKIK
jgi:5-methyltetrahydrofolate--homocysteine methyltransferase